MTLKLLDVEAMRGQRDLMLTLNGETFEIGIRDGSFQKISGVVRSTKNGDVIEWLDLTDGGIEIAHNDCVVRNCFVGARQFHSIYQLSGAQNLLVDMVTCNGRPDGKTNQNPSNSDFVFAHNRVMTIRRSLFIDAANDSLNSVGGLIEKSAIMYGGFTPGAHADAISVHTTVAAFTAQKLYIDYRQYPDKSNVIPNACIKFVSVPSIGQGQGAGNGIAHDVMCYDSVCIGGGYTCYLDTRYSKVERNIVGMSYWYPTTDQGDVYPPVPGGYKNNQNTGDVDEDYAFLGEDDNGGIDPPDPPDPQEPTNEELLAMIVELQGQVSTTNDRIDTLIGNLHQV
jgi:hypothetical protein